MADPSTKIWGVNYNQLNFEVLPYVTTIVAILTSWMVCQGVHNRYFHPLAKVPGPYMAGVTSLYLAYKICTVPTYGLKLHRRYGRLVRLTPNMVSFSDPEMLPLIYHRHADKPNFYGSWMFGDTAAHFQSLSHQSHALKKKIISPCCSMKAMKNFEAEFDERVLDFITVARDRFSRPGDSIDFSEYLRWFLSDTFSQLAYGEAPGAVQAGKDVGGLVGSLQNVYSFSASAAVLPWLLIPLFKSPLLRKYLWNRTQTFQSMDKIFRRFELSRSKRQNLENLRQKRCFLDGIESHPSYHFTHEDVKAEYITFSAATLDGVAAFISPFVDNMMTHPATRMRLVAEIRAADAQGELSHPVVRFDETCKLPFFMACVKETLRRDTPAQTILPRIISPGGVSIHGHYLPAGTEVGASPFIIHRDVGIFGANPEEFRPDRWLEHPRINERMEKFGMWWGYGDRECTGKYYAQIEMQKLVLEIFRNFDVELVDPGKRFHHERWAVGMFWRQHLYLREAKEKQT